MRRYAFIKPNHDAHTLGINAIKSQLISCHQFVLIADDPLSLTTNNGRFSHEDKIALWLQDNQITHLGLSYRLDELDALNTFSSLIELCQKNQLFTPIGYLQKIYFAGLPRSCRWIQEHYPNQVITFMGCEDMSDVLRQLDLSENEIPPHILEGSRYDHALYTLAEDYIKNDFVSGQSIQKNTHYPEYGLRTDRLDLRLKAHQASSDLPLTRLHVGPYHQDRTKAVDQFKDWCKQLASSGYLDILSIGSSQLTQSNFNENWEGRANGGGVPIQNEQEYEVIYEASRPMLVRTYSGTHRIDKLAEIHERSLNIAWHAMSLWWFNQLDGRGPNDLLTNLIQSEKALEYIAQTHKPYEPNIAHHFAFRGSDDVTTILSAVLAAQFAHKKGVKEFVLQVMLNTPRYTWGIVDIAKARAILELIEPLRSDRFKLYLQPRAGLDFFAPDLEKAKVQLAMVSMLMDDIEPEVHNSPPIVHVVSYSEAVFMANPSVMDESIQISLGAIQFYRQHKQKEVLGSHFEDQIQTKTKQFVQEVEIILKSIKQYVKNYLSAQGFYDIYAAGYLPTPYLWHATEIFPNAIYFDSKYENGSVILVNKEGNTVDAKKRVEFAQKNI